MVVDRLQRFEVVGLDQHGYGTDPARRHHRDGCVAVTLAMAKSPADDTDEAILAAAKAQPNVAANLEGKTVVKEMVVRGRLVVLAAK